MNGLHAATTFLRFLVKLRGLFLFEHALFPRSRTSNNQLKNRFKFFRRYVFARLGGPKFISRADFYYSPACLFKNSSQFTAGCLLFNRKKVVKFIFV